MTPLYATVLEASVRITVLAAAVWLALRICRIRSGAVRHTAWLAVLVAMPLMPLLPRLVPEKAAVPVAVQLPAPVLDPAPALPAMIPDSAPPPQPAEPVWPRVLWAVYGTVTAALLFRLFTGWRNAARVLRNSEPVAAQGLLVYESPDVAAPVTIGIIRPKILLPDDWTEWPDAKLRAVLAHELAHVERRDTLVSLLARLNRTVFWFHPLSWWLERELAMAAEQACDDAGVTAIGESRRYAEVLVEMAEAVHRRGRLLSFEGVGVDGTGLLGQRIDRILRGAAALTVTRRRKAILALACTAAIFVAIACRRNSPPAARLKPDPETIKELAQQDASSKLVREAINMKQAQAKQMEARLERNPEDRDARHRLLLYYQTRRSAEARTLFRARKLWLVEHHPDDGLCRLETVPPDVDDNPQERAAWLAAMERQPNNPTLLGSAAIFFRDREPERAEELWEQVLRLDPQEFWGVYRLAGLYARALHSGGAHADRVRRKLEQTTSKRLRNATNNTLRVLERGRSVPLGNPTFTTPPKTARPAPPRDWVLLSEAVSTYQTGAWDADGRSDLPEAKRKWERARQCAEQALEVDGHSPAITYQANVTLGMVAFRAQGDRRKAARYLLEAAKAPVKDVDLGNYNWQLPILLLHYGGPEERQAVIAFFDQMSRKEAYFTADCRSSAAKLRAGYMPRWYQLMEPQLN